MENKLRYIIYTRKSQENRDRQVLSIDSQISELREFADKEGLEIIKELQESQTAFKPGRPVFAQLMEMLEMGLADAVLVWKPDRVARNALDGGRFIQAMDDGHILELRTPYERFRREDNRMMLYIHFGMSNDYSRQISANVKRGNREKYRRGEFCGKAPLGYINAKVGNSSNIFLDPEKSPLVKRLFEEFSTGKYSVVDMVNKAESWGLRSVNNRAIAKSGMYTLLRRPVYYGIYKHAGEFHQGSYEPLITKELFDRVQDVLSDRGKPRKKEWTHTYKTLVKCAECGCSITATTKTKHYKNTDRTATYIYYHCTKKRGYCSQKPITEEEMQKMMLNAVSKIEIDREAWELGVDLLKAKNTEVIEQNLQSTKSLESEKEKIDRELSKLLEMRLSEELTSEEYNEAKKLFLDRKLSLKEKLEDKEHTSGNWLELAENFFETCFQARTILESDNAEAKRDLIQSVGENLLLRDKNLEFSFKMPYDILLKPEARSDVQGWKESNFRHGFWRPGSYH